ncbi:hypothetical protein HGH93_12145 [Chitinophaga polysaccharea]|uniref:hypothetical protein n=1 Tax=Chitinophaga polysaccharea TaxID=1293035 RepID=UPI001455C311|nr:hypothetical protein [Chitinophaga polysaccharea]NLR58858.1 hypothetical protein [Chitinophaga polysaccharea]
MKLSDTPLGRNAPRSENLLLAIHTELSAAPIFFRADVCKECDWSTSVLYRRMRTKDHINKNGKLILVFSREEEEKLKAAFNARIAWLEGCYKKYFGTSDQ